MMKSLFNIQNRLSQFRNYLIFTIYKVQLASDILQIDLIDFEFQLL